MKVLSGDDKSASLGYESDGKVGVELIESDRKVATGDAFLGIGIKSPRASDIISSASSNGGTIITEVSDFAYAASLIPDEDEMKTFPVRYGRLLDPDGYSIEVLGDSNAVSLFYAFFCFIVSLSNIFDSQFLHDHNHHL